MREKRRELALDLPEPLPVKGGPYRLWQLAINLLGNANRHAPPASRPTS